MTTHITRTQADGGATSPQDPFIARVEAILRRKGQVILYGPPGTGKTFRALEVVHEMAARQAFRKPFARLNDLERERVAGGEKSLVRICTFHPGWGYEDFMEGLRPKTNEGRMVFEPRDGIFKCLCADAAESPNDNFFLVIDEINRGDLPRIFGELITTIEFDKREQKIRLPVTGTFFAVPRNVFLIGTMNTADRSVSLLDTALRRRFGFVELMPDSKLLRGRKVGGLLLSAWLDALNMRIRKNLKRDARNLQIGHAYLMPAQQIISMADLGRVLREDIIPLLEEYCYDDFQMLKDILGGELVNAEDGRIREELFELDRELDLIGALHFEEMQSLLLSGQEDPIASVGDSIGDTAEDEDDPSAAS